MFRFGSINKLPHFSHSLRPHLFTSSPVVFQSRSFFFRNKQKDSPSSFTDPNTDNSSSNSNLNSETPHNSNKLSSLHRDFTVQDETLSRIDVPNSSSSHSQTISIDRSTLPLSSYSSTLNPNKSAHTPLVDVLKQMIHMRGPLSLHDFMFQVLQHPKYGYYMSKQNVLPNATERGDFITSPEISSLFGELICVWLLYTWQNMNSPSHIQLVELGPGKGTLMEDIIRTAKTFPAFYRALSIHLLESSPVMRKHQQETLKVTITSTQEATQAMEQCYVEKHTEQSQLNQYGVAMGEMAQENELAQQLHTRKQSSDANTNSASISDNTVQGSDVVIKGIIADKLRDIPVEWISHIKQVSTDAPVFFLAHEFFDALPVRQFEYTTRGWCEKLVDIDEGTGPHHFRYVLSNGPTLASLSLISPERFPPQQQQIGNKIEICPSALACMEDICGVLHKSGGAALVIDYGEDHINSDSLQSVNNHKFVDPLSSPGENDLTAWVDFSSLRAVVHRCASLLKYDVYAQPLITQSHLLRELHIAKRLEKVLQGKTDEAEIDAIMNAATRIVDPQQMGKLFKVFCVTNSNPPLAKDIFPFDFPDALLNKSEQEQPSVAKTAMYSTHIIPTPTTPLAAAPVISNTSAYTTQFETTPAAAITTTGVSSNAEKEKDNLARRFRLAQAVKQRSNK